jgi:hypothetical protein
MRFRNLGGSLLIGLVQKRFVTLKNIPPAYEPNSPPLMVIQCRRLTTVTKAWQIKLNTVHGSTLIYFLFVPY